MKPLMIVGTASNAGKSLVVTALCRLLKQAGHQVAPFKAQNMSLNAYVCADGGEIGYAQALQAWAAGLEPTVAMNPILLKPQGNMTSQVILQGQVAGTYQAMAYYQDWFTAGWQAVTQSLDQLSAQYDWLVCEGAGSPAEVNLWHRDLTNMRVAAYLQAPTLLVADIDRGGALAHVVGTLQVMPPEWRRLFVGIVINKFRGVPELLQPGLDWLTEATGLPVVAVLPWLDLALPAEDSVSLWEWRSRRSADLEIAVLRLPYIANFTDFDPLRAEPSVRLRFVGLDEPLGSPDVVILPGTKATIHDWQAVQTSGMAHQLTEFGGEIVGICGGMQMLGQAIADPMGLEGVAGEYAGLGLLPLRTEFASQKTVQQSRATFLWPAETDVTGYEIHSGRSEIWGGTPIATEAALGVVQGKVWGTYLHGVFDNHRWRRLWLNQLRQSRGLRPLPLLDGHYQADREHMLDQLATAWHAALNLESIAALTLKP